MSLYSRRALLLLLPAALTACGFTPVYAPGGTADRLRGRVEVAAPESVEAYYLVQSLEDRLGRAASPEFRLSLTLSTQSQGQAITASNETTRYSLVGRVDYAMTRIDDDEEIATGSVDNFTGYSATGSTVDTLAAERDARERLMLIMAEQITTQLYSTLDLPE